MTYYFHDYWLESTDSLDLYVTVYFLVESELDHIKAEMKVACK